MKKTLLILLIFLALFSITSFGKQFGVGFIIGQPTGLSVKYFLTSKSASAFDFALATAYNKDLESFQDIYFHVDYLYHFFNVFYISGGQFAPYFGIGPSFSITTESESTQEISTLLRFPIGMTFLFARAPIDFFAEIVPSLSVMPETKFTYNFGLGMRFYF